MAGLNFNFGGNKTNDVTVDRNAMLQEIDQRATDEELDTLVRLLRTVKLRATAMKAARKRLPKQ